MSRAISKTQSLRCPRVVDGITASIAAVFRREKFAVVRSLVDSTTRLWLCRYAIRSAREGLLSSGDGQVPGTPSAYGDAEMDRLLQRLLVPIEQATSLRLYPTYSYLRIYKHGDILFRHLDRPACEVTASVNLGSGAFQPWPLWIEGPYRTTHVVLAPGDGVLIRGLECPHWRNTFQGRWAAQVFLHYVERSGTNAGWKYDGRLGLGSSPAPARN
jgi:hypothetical protein